MVRSFLNAASISEREGGVWAVQSMPSLREGSAAVRFREIKFMINLIEGVEARCSLKLSSASYCASSVASLKPKSSIHNEPAQRMDKSPIISDNSHCRFTGLLCSDQKRSLKHLIPTVGYLGFLHLPTGRISQPCQETADNWETKRILPTLPPFLFSSATIAHIQKHFRHMYTVKKKITCYYYSDS